jgi:oligopeptide/dipeptide ABC transporter ATP-binding protein
MNELLTVTDLKVRFRVNGALKCLLRPSAVPFIEAVGGVSLSIGAGETFGLVGESGSGKTTLGRAIIGLTAPHAGRIVFRGTDIAGLGDRAYKPYRRQMAMMFQDPVGCLSPRLKIRRLLAQPLKIHGQWTGRGDAAIRDLLAGVGLPAEFADRYPHQLSGGQARRVGLARALALSPRLIIADEPTAGLDVSIQGDILNLLGKMRREQGVSVLAITHNLAVIRHVSDRMATMYMGRFVELGPTASIFEGPRHPYTHALLSANPVPDPDARVQRAPLSGDVPSLLNRPSGCTFHTRCPHARARCRQHRPAMQAITDDHLVRCHYPLGGRGG